MAVNTRVNTELLIPKKWSGQRAHEISPERTKIWVEPKPKTGNRKVGVIYYLSRHGQLEHPHFIEVPLSSSHGGLYLRDVIDRLESLRGEGVAHKYSWSSKRCYKNGYVWQDLAEDDLIHPTSGHDYVLKGSELDRNALTQTKNSSGKGRDASAAISGKRKNQSWGSFENDGDDRRECVVYKCQSSREVAGKPTAEEASKTEEKRRKRGGGGGEHGNKTAELSKGELSPPPTASSPPSSEGVSGSGDVNGRVAINDGAVENEYKSKGKLKALPIFMQLFTCGSLHHDKHHGSPKSKE